MASKNLLPVAALCSALATGMPVAALATPAVDVPLPAVNCLATNQMSTIARQRFSLAQASISTSGCLRRRTSSSIVVDTERSCTTDGPLTGCVICTWRAAATDADGDSCDVELRLDITLSDDSADGATVAFDSTFFEDGGGVCLGCVPSSADGTQPAISFTASLKMTKAGTDAAAKGETPPDALRERRRKPGDSRQTANRIAQPNTRDRSQSHRYQRPNTKCASRPRRSGAPRDGMERSRSGRTRPLDR